MSIIVESGVSSGCIVENDTMQVFGSALHSWRLKKMEGAVY